MDTVSSPLRHSSRQVSSSFFDRSNANLLFLGHVREIRAEAQNLQQYEIELKSKLTDPHLNIADVAHTWQTVQMPAYQRHVIHVKDLFTVIGKLMEDNPVLLDRDGDAIIKIENSWERVDPLWPRFPENQDPDENAMLTTIGEVDKILCQVIREAEILTLPERINDRLSELRVGQYIDFHAEFSDELPEPAARHDSITLPS